MKNVFKYSKISKEDDENIEMKLKDFIAGRYPFMEFVSSRKSYSVRRFDFKIKDADLCTDKMLRELASKIEIVLDTDKVSVSRTGAMAIINVPRKKKDTLYLGEGLNEFIASPKCPVRCYFGERDDGFPAEINFADTPHVLIGGQSGAGKTVLLSDIILSMCYKYSPDEIGLYLIDHKKELEMFKVLPHVKMTAFTNSELQIIADHLRGELEYRIGLMSSEYTNIEEYNKRHKNKLSYNFLIFDEADFVLQHSSSLGPTADTMRLFVKDLASMARSVGIYVIIASQKPSKANIDTTIKSNLSARIALRVGSLMDSRMIIEGRGAELLNGKGDGLMKGLDTLVRFQSAYTELDERKKAIKEIVKEYR